MRLFILYIWFLTINLSLFSKDIIYNQKAVDSLEHDLEISKAKAETYFKLFELHNEVSQKKSIEYLKNAIEYSEKEGNSKIYYISCHNLGDIYSNDGDYEEALKYLDFSLKSAKAIKADTLISKTLNDIGFVYEKKSDYEIALDYYNQALKINEEINFRKGISENYNNIGMIYSNWGKFYDAISYLKQVVKIDSTDNRISELPIGYNNIGFCYYHLDSLEIALYYYYKAIKIDSIANNSKNISNYINNIGLVYYKKGKIDTAIIYFTSAMKISKAQNQMKEAALYLTNIAAIYALVQNDTTKSIKYLEEAYIISKKYNYGSIISSIYKIYYKIYSKNGDYKKALDYYKSYKNIRDSIFTEESQNSLMHYKVKYQTEKKEKEIEILKKDDEVNNLQIKKQRITIFSILIGVLLLFILIIYIYKAYKNKQKAYSEINKQKDEISEQNEELNQQNEEILAQRDEIETQKNVLEAQHGQITDSIIYAKNIQQALLPPIEIIEKILPEHFIINLPRDIVSGDFYWAKEVNDKLIIAVADCTGHGVPGAFMSMLGTAFLTEIVSKDRIIKPSIILDELKTQIVKSLHQTSDDFSSKDGMDIVICTIDYKAKKLEFAGAYNPLIIINNNQFTEIKGDKMPIGIYKYGKSFFTNHSIDCSFPKVVESTFTPLTNLLSIILNFLPLEGIGPLTVASGLSELFVVFGNVTMF
jgi:tetratricopeptide (TPR) repeat protein